MKLIEVPYLGQLDNKKHPRGACNVTSIAMCLKAFGFVGDGSQSQFEDQLFSRCENRGWDRHDPLDLKKLAESYPGVKDDYTDTGSLADIRAAIDQGRICVIHTFSTPSGHIFVIFGYDDTGFFVHDPFGEWFRWGYREGNGKRLHYSNRMVGACAGAWTYAQAQDFYESEKFDPEKISNMYLHRIYRT